MSDAARKVPSIPLSSSMKNGYRFLESNLQKAIIIIMKSETSLRAVKTLLNKFDSSIPKVKMKVRMAKKITASMEQFFIPNTSIPSRNYGMLTPNFISSPLK